MRKQCTTLMIFGFAILMVFLSPVHCSRKTRIRDRKPACAEWKPITLELNNIQRNCCSCGPGTYVNELCSPDDPATTTCRPCGPGTYMTEYVHGRNSCHVDDLVCPSGLVRIPAEPDKAPRCDCPPGFYKTEANACSPHTPCPPGEGVKILPTPFRDTECELCPFGYHSPRSSTMDGCSLLSERRLIGGTPIILDNENKNTTKTLIGGTPIILDNENNPMVYDSHSEKDATDVSLGCLEMVVISVIATVVLMIIVVVLLFFIYIRHNRQNNGSCQEQRSNTANNREGDRLRVPQDLKIDRRKDSFNSMTDVSSSEINSIDSGSLSRNRIAIRLSQTSSVLVSTASTESLLLTCNGSLPLTENDSHHGSEVSIPQMLSPHQKMMIKIKLSIMSHVALDEIKTFFRVFAAMSGRTNTEVLLDNLVEKSSDFSDLFCKVFDQLMKDLSEEVFNPETLQKHFLNVSGNRVLSDMIKTVSTDDISGETSQAATCSIPEALTRPKDLYQSPPDTLI